MKTLDDDTAFHDHIRTTLDAVARTTPTDETEIATPLLGQRRRFVATWAAAASVVLLAGTALSIRDDTSSSPTAPAATPPTAIEFLVPSTMDDDKVVYTGTRQGPIETHSGAAYVPWADRVYAPADGFSSPRQLIGVTDSGPTFCPDGDRVDVNGNEASVCGDFYDVTALSWAEPDGAVNVVAGGRTTLPQLIQFADAFARLRTDTATDTTATDTTGAQTPEGWTLLSDNREFISPASHQVEYTIGPTSAADGLEYIEVRMWSHVPSTALYAIGFPLVGESVTVRGQPAILDAKEADNVFLFWVEPSGVVVSLQALAGDRQTVIAFANGLRVTDRTGFDAFLVDAVDPPFALPRDQLPNAEFGDAEVSTTADSGG